MDIKKWLMGGIVGGVAFFLLGYLIYGMLLMNFMTDNPGTAGDIGKTELDFLYLGVGNLASGFLLAYIFIKGNINTMAAGIVAGAVVGGLFALSMDTIMYATTTIVSKKAMLADVVASSVMSAIVGGILGMVFGMGKKAA